MHALYSWVAQIVLLILFAIILEMLLPNESFQKYVKMVIGLVIIIAILNPIVRLFHIPEDQILSQFQLGQSNNSIKNSIKMNKSEIQASQDAYILKQVRVQMINLVKGELKKNYGLAIQNLNIKRDQSNNNTLSHVTVTLGQAQKKSTTAKNGQVTIKPVQAVKPVRVQVTENNQTTKQNSKVTSKTKKVREYLAKQWGLSTNQISVTMEGGGN